MEGAEQDVIGITSEVIIARGNAPRSSLVLSNFRRMDPDIVRGAIKYLAHRELFTLSLSFLFEKKYIYIYTQGVQCIEQIKATLLESGFKHYVGTNVTFTRENTLVVLSNDIEQHTIIVEFVFSNRLCVSHVQMNSRKGKKITERKCTICTNSNLQPPTPPP